MMVSDLPPTSDPRMLAALEYNRAAWPLLPLDDSLTPLEHEPVTARDDVILAWSRHPGAHPGVVLGRPLGGGRQHLVALIDRCTAASLEYLTERGAIEQLGLGHLTAEGTRVWLFATPEPLPSRELAPGLEVRGDGVLPLPPAPTARGEWRWRKGQFFPSRPLIAAPHWLRIAEPAAPPDPAAPVVSNDWHAELTRNKSRAIVPSLGNAAMILRCDSRYAGRLAYDEMRLTVALDGRPLGDADVAGMREQIERRYGCQLSDRTMRDALLVVGEARRFHPVRQYLDGLKWDGVARLDHVAADVLHAPGELARSMVRRFFLSAVVRARAPGVKCDTCLVLYGPQGVLKSTFFRVLAGEWFSDTHLDPTNKDALQQIAGAWLYELGEIDSITSRKHASDLKRFMTSATDSFRPPYERTVRQVPRAGVMVGSTNKDRFLTDETGSRRFWVVRCEERIDVAALARQRDQLWAEAAHLIDAFVVECARTRGWDDSIPPDRRWWLTSAEERAREEDAEQYAEQDPWRDLIVRYLQGQYREGKVRGDYTCAEIALDVLKIEKRDLARALEMRIGDVMRGLGLRRRKFRIERGDRRYPPTWTWEFVGDERPEWITTEQVDPPDQEELSL